MQNVTISAHVTVVNNLYQAAAYFCQVFECLQAGHHLLRTDLRASPEITYYMSHINAKNKTERKQQESAGQEK